MSVQLDNTSLTVYNLPYAAEEADVRSMFPAAKSVNILRSQSVPPRSRGMCVLQFNNPRDCQQAYDECLEGKEVDGRFLRAEYSQGRRSSSFEHVYNDRFNAMESQSRPPYSSDSYGQQNYETSYGNNGSGNSCTLTVSNLPYSATEREIMQEFPDALKVALAMDEQGRSKGVAHVTFPSSDQCTAALDDLGQKLIGGRTIRGRIQKDSEIGQASSNSRSREYGNQREYSNHRGNQRNNNQRDYNNQREYNSQREYNTQRDYNNQRDHSNQRDFNQRDHNNQRDFNQRDYNTHRDFNNQRDSATHRSGRQFDYNSGRGDGSRYQGGGNVGGGQSNRSGQRDFGRQERFDRTNQRRDRSPVRGEPVRGYGSSKGPRITSAVIQGTANASSSESSSSEED